MAENARKRGRPYALAYKALDAPSEKWSGAPGYAELLGELRAAGDEQAEYFARSAILARLSVWRGWADGTDLEEGLPTDAEWTPEQVQIYAKRRARRLAGWDDAEMHGWGSRRKAIVECPVTREQRTQELRIVWGRGCGCRTCLMIARGGDLRSTANRAGRGWLLEELVGDADPRTISASDESARSWRCPGCGEARTASVRSRLESATGHLACPVCDARALPGAPTTTLGAGVRPRGRAIRATEIAAMGETVLGAVRVPTLDGAPETSLAEIAVDEAAGTVTATIARYGARGALVVDEGVTMALEPLTAESWVRPAQKAHRGGRRVRARVVRLVVRCERHGVFSAPPTEVLDLLRAHGTTCRHCGFLADRRAAAPDANLVDAIDLGLADAAEAFGDLAAEVLSAAPRAVAGTSMVRPVESGTIEEWLGSPDPARRQVAERLAARAAELHRQRGDA